VLTGNLGHAINKKTLLVLGVAGCMLATACYYWSTFLISYWLLNQISADGKIPPELKIHKRGCSHE
jgi:hypothetical protein